MGSIITAAMVLTMYYTAFNSSDVNNMYNIDKECSLRMEQKMEYCNDYDEQGRLVNKEMYCWDEAKKVWTRSIRLTYKYYKHGYNLEVYYWNHEKQDYGLPSEVILFRSQAPSLTKVKTYKMNEKKNNMYLTSSMLLMEPLDNP